VVGEVTGGAVAERERTGGRSLQRRERARVLGGWDGGRPRRNRGRHRAAEGRAGQYWALSLATVGSAASSAAEISLFDL